MADQVEVYIYNEFTDDINITRELPDGSNDLDITISQKNEEKTHSEGIFLPGPEVSLVINAPEGRDINECYIKVAKPSLDLLVLHSRTGSNWRVNIAPNDLDPEVPTTVNVNVGEEGP
jgi:hypothetical protein